jgi:acyl-CoA thioesterase-1
MKSIVPVLAAALLLAGCDREAPTAPPTATPSAAVQPAPKGPEVRIVALGDSLFAGYGLGPGESYPARLEAALRARGINAVIMNAGVSGDTTAGGLQRLEFTLNSQAAPPALAIISLGGNDMLRAVSPEETRANLDAILTRLGERKIPAVLMGMLAAPNLGAEYRGAFDPIYPALARKHGAGLVPFFLQPLIGKPQLIQSDRIHPTREGIEVLVAATVENVVQALPAKPAGTLSPS